MKNVFANSQSTAVALFFVAAVLFAGCTEGENDLIEPVERVPVLVAVEDVPRRTTVAEALRSGLVEEREQDKQMTVGALRVDEVDGLSFIDLVDSGSRVDADMVATPDEFGNVGPRPSGFRYISLSDLASGEVVGGDWADSCGPLVTDGRMRFLGQQQPTLEPVWGRPFFASDFSPDLGVFVMNDAGNDGPAYVLYNIEMQQTDDSTIEMRNPVTGDLLVTFELDTSDPADWEWC